MPKAFALKPEEVCPVFLPDPADPLGSVSPMASQRKAINADDSLQRAQAAAFENGLSPRHAVYVGRNIGPDGKPMSSRPMLTANNAERSLRG